MQNRKMVNLLYTVLIFCFGAVTIQASCSNGNGCQCDFDDETMFKSKSEILAAAVGALGPLVAIGGGFGIWKLIQGKMIDSTKDMPKGGPEKHENRSVSASTDSTRASSSRSTPLTLNDMDIDDEMDFRETPTPSTFDPKEGISSPKWSHSRDMPPSLMNNRTPLSAKSDDLNGWMF